MSTLVQLNTFADGTLTFTDSRPSDVRFSFPTARDVEVDITSQSFTLQRRIDIIEIVQPSQAQVQFIVDVSGVAGTTVNFGTLPTGVSVSSSAGVYTVNGIDSISDWEAVRAPTITLPTADAIGTFTYDCTIAYVNDGVGKSKTWQVGNNYLLANIGGVFGLTATFTNVQKETSANLIANTTVSANGEFVIRAVFSVLCNAKATYDDEVTMNTISTFTALQKPELNNVTNYTANGDAIAIDWFHLLYNSYPQYSGIPSTITALAIDGGHSVGGTEADSYNTFTGLSSIALDVDGYVQPGDTVPGVRTSFAIDTSGKLHTWQRSQTAGSAVTPTEEDDGYEFDFAIDLSDFNSSFTLHTKGLSAVRTGYSLYDNNSSQTQSYATAISNDQDKVYLFEYNSSSASDRTSTYIQKIYEKTYSGEGEFNLTACSEDLFLASTDDSNEIYIWNMSDGSFNRKITVAYSNPTGIALSNNMLIVSHTSGTKVYDISASGNDALVATLNAGNSCGINDDWAIVGSISNQAVYVYEIESRTSISLWKTLTNPGASNNNYGTATAINNNTRDGIVAAVTSDDKVYVYEG